MNNNDNRLKNIFGNEKSRLGVRPGTECQNLNDFLLFTVPHMHHCIHTACQVLRLLWVNNLIESMINPKCFTTAPTRINHPQRIGYDKYKWTSSTVMLWDSHTFVSRTHWRLTFTLNKVRDLIPDYRAMWTLTTVQTRRCSHCAFIKQKTNATKMHVLCFSARIFHSSEYAMCTPLFECRVCMAGYCVHKHNFHGAKWKKKISATNNATVQTIMNDQENCNIWIVFTAALARQNNRPLFYNFINFHDINSKHWTLCDRCVFHLSSFGEFLSQITSMQWAMTHTVVTLNRRNQNGALNHICSVQLLIRLNWKVIRWRRSFIKDHLNEFSIVCLAHSR